MDTYKIRKWREDKTRKAINDTTAAKCTHYTNNELLSVVLKWADEMRVDCEYRFNLEGMDYVNSPTCGSACWEESEEGRTNFFTDMAEIRYCVRELESRTVNGRETNDDN